MQIRIPVPSRGTPGVRQQALAADLVRIIQKVAVNTSSPHPTPASAAAANRLQRLAQIRVRSRHVETARRGGAQGRRQRGDRQPRPQRQAGRRRGDPPGGPDRPRRPRLRAPDEAARRAGPTRRARPAGAAEPDLPGVRGGRRRRARPAGASRRSSAPRRPAGSRRPTTSTCSSSNRSRASSSPAGSTRRRTPGTTTTPGWRPASCRPSWSTRRSKGSAFPGSRATTRSRSSRRWGTCSRSATRGSGCCSARPITFRRRGSWRRRGRSPPAPASRCGRTRSRTRSTRSRPPRRRRPACSRRR